MLQLKAPTVNSDDYESKKAALGQSKADYVVTNEYRIAVLATLRLNVFRELTLLSWLMSLEHLRQRLALSRCVLCPCVVVVVAHRTPNAADAL